MRKPVGFLICLFLFIGVFAQAQIQVVPIYSPEKASSPSSARTKPPTSTVPTAPKPYQTAKALPFFDDFSLYSGKPDTMLWMKGSGVRINNSMAINHPSRNVATFDGLNAQGVPYDTLSDLTRGGTDTLTSVPINLVGANVRLIFFWQARGLGELPDAEDSLVLQFKAVDGVWSRVKAFQGQVINDNFTQENIHIQSSTYFHENFQFRFLAYGKRSGAFDVWNIDYVYLNAGIEKTGDFFIKDVACQRNVNSFLKRYTAMPLHQYKKDPAIETNSSVRIEITNLFNNNNPVTFNYEMRDSQKVYQTISAGSVGPNGRGILETLNPDTLTRQIVSAEVDDATLAKLKSLPNTKPVIIKQKFTIITGEEKDIPSIPGTNLTLNDTISNFTVLDDYYAYDDGTAEYGAGINQRLGRIAVRYVLDTVDYIKGVNLYVARLKKDLRGQSFVLQIFDNANGKPNKILYQASTPVTYSANQDQFSYIPLGFYQAVGDSTVLVPLSIAVKDTFYVGWQQTTQDLLPVGLDKNTYFGSNIFYNLGTKTSDWQTDASIKGSFMVRPVMGVATVVTGINEEPIASTALIVSPNPTTGILSWNDALFTSAKVYDLGGRLLFSQILQHQSNPQIDLNFLQNGLYLLHLSNGKRTLVRKVVIAK